MNIFKYILISLSTLTLLACGPDNSPKPKLFEDQRKALDQAKSVSNAAQQQIQEQQQKLEKETQ